MMKPAFFAVFAASSLLAVSAPVWEDPAVNEENRLPPRAYTVPEGGDWTMSLNGTWRYWWCGGVDQQPQDFMNIGFDDSRWFDIDVPSCVEMRGWGVPHYTNHRYPHKKDPPRIGTEYNPVSSYIRRFTLPDSWKGRRTVLRFDGVYSCHWVWVNGKYIGYSEDSKLPSEFDITDALVAGENTLAVRVYRWCDGSYMEDQDMFRFSGIFRDVTLVSFPESGIRDFVFNTTPDASYRDWTASLNVETYGDAGEISAALFDADGKKAGDFIPKGKGTFSLALSAPRLWSDEDPYLYTLVVKCRGDERRVKVGVRSYEIKGGLLLVNGRAIKFKGVNRHETSPVDGRQPTYEEMVKDVELFRRNNINCLRMSHYPNDRRMYDLCDEYGIYVCAEANVEAHGIGYGRDCLPERPEWHHTIIERNVRNALFYRNHASVFMWSVGNEVGWGEGLSKAMDEVKKIDPSRIFLGFGWKSGDGEFGADNTKTDVTSGQYSPFDMLRGFIKDPRPHWLCEYSCAMGNGMGNFKEYWDVYYESDKLSGGCIWDWVDQAVWMYTDRVDKNGNRVRYLGYGGDNDEQPNDGPYCGNGLVDWSRKPTAKLNEVKHVQQPVVVSTDDAAKGEAEFWNRYEFSYADDRLYGVWEFFVGGVKVESGELALPRVAPRAKGRIQLPQPKTKAASGSECFYRVSFRLKDDSRWAKRGYELAWNQLKWGATPELEVPAVGADRGGVMLEECAQGIFVSAGSTKAVFCRKSGTVSSLEMAGRTVIKDIAGIVHGPRLQVERAFNDSDNWMRRPFLASGLTQLRFHPYAMKAVREDGAVKVTCPVRVTGAKSGGFEYSAEWTFRVDGTVLVRNFMEPFGKVPDIPRVGSFMRLNGAFENVAYYGRGPWENMIDRKAGCDIALWRSTVTAQYVDYLRPQDCGGKTDVRWVEFTDPKDGRGVRFSAVGEPFFMQALRFTREDLDSSRHRPTEPRKYIPLVPRDEICFSLDCRQMGLGCYSCGPIPLEQYRFKPAKTEWSYLISPVGE